MPTALRSAPPPPLAALSQPRAKFLRCEDLLARELASLDPNEKAARLALAVAFDDEFKREPRISNVQFGESIGLAANIVARWRSGRSPIRFERLSLLPPHHRARFWTALGAALLAFRHR